MKKEKRKGKRIGEQQENWRGGEMKDNRKQKRGKKK